MQISLNAWTTGMRPCRFSLCLQDGSVYADFDVDGNRRVYLVRISLDGYGCCESAELVDRMSADESTAVLDMVERRDFTAPLAMVLRAYLAANMGVLWEDALQEYDLI